MTAPAIDIDELERLDKARYDVAGPNLAARRLLYASAETAYNIALRNAAPELFRRARLAATQADEIAALRAERDEAREELSTWQSVFPDIAPDSVLPDRSKLEADLASARALLVTAGEAMEPVRKRAQFLDETPDEITHWHPAVGSPVTAGDICRIALVAAAIDRRIAELSSQDAGT